jgi:hypothetical protein
MRAVLTLTATGGAFLVEDSGLSSPISDLRAEPERLEFRAQGIWYATRVADGVLAGRTSTAADQPPPGSSLWSGHVTGWSGTVFDEPLVPRAFDLLIDDDRHAMLRLDRDGHSGRILGRLKVYASTSSGSAGEQAEEDLDVEAWDGSLLRVLSRTDAPLRVYQGQVTGRTIAGDFTDDGGLTSRPWQGVRADLLAFGFRPRAATDAELYRRVTARRLSLLMMDGGRPPRETTVDTSTPGAPFAPTDSPNARDDDDGDWPAEYALSELHFEHAIADRHGGPDLIRLAHGWLAVPAGEPPRTGFAAVIALNGHFGSGRHVMSPSDYPYWYGDAFARRGFVVLALDVSHRPLEDRADLYTDMVDGDDPAGGNKPHPAIAAAGLDSDWEEDGERVWDVMRAVDVLEATPGVDPTRIFVAGLSMGGEVSTFAMALDPRIAAAVVAGYSPDMAVVSWHGNHACWRWRHAEIREYLDVSDLHALIAPRPIVIETGQTDHTYSAFHAPFASDKQVLRRSRAAYGAASEQLVHYLHGDGHVFHAGDTNGVAAISVPTEIRPLVRGSESWQLDASTVIVPKTVFELVPEY